MTNDQQTDDIESGDDNPELDAAMPGPGPAGTGFSAPLGHTHPALRPQSNT